MKIKYYGMIAGGRGPDVWDKQIMVEATSFKEAVEIIYKDLPYDSDLVELRQED